MKVHQPGRRIVRLLVLALAVSIAPAAAIAAAPTASATVCAAGWGSLAKQRATSTSKQITNVRSGRHQCFDRLVIVINGRGKGKPGYKVRYVKQVTMDRRQRAASWWRQAARHRQGSGV
jgi:hypothetical protein